MDNEKDLDEILHNEGEEKEREVDTSKSGDFDVLDILDDVEVDLNNDGNEDKEEKEVEKTDSTSSKVGVGVGREDSSEKIKVLRDAIRNSDLFGGEGNMGSGDVIEDLIGWLQNRDKIPSDPLSSFTANSEVKLERSIDFNILMAMSRRASNLLDFISESEKALFDPNDILGMEVDDLKERHTAASKSFDNMMELTRKLLHSLKKDKRDEEVDKLKMLLSSLPSEKLVDLIRVLK